MPFELPFDFKDLKRLSISACGTAYLAGLVAKYWFERLARLPVEIDVASEFRYREAPLEPGDVALFVSQSGETADTLASLRYAKAQRAAHRSRSSTCRPRRWRAKARSSRQTLAGLEIGVASTKAFTCQLTVLLCLAIAAGRARGTLSRRGREGARRRAHRRARPDERGAEAGGADRGSARELSKAKDVLYLGRGTSYPLALEGALKLKEISYIHAEGYAAGELKHGPIALIDETMPVIVIAPHDRWFEKTVSNMQEVAARGGRIILITDDEGRGGDRPRHAGDDRHADRAPGRGADRPRHAGAAPRLSHGGLHGEGRRPAAQPGKVGHGRVSG